MSEAYIEKREGLRGDPCGVSAVKLIVYARQPQLPPPLEQQTPCPQQHYASTPRLSHDAFLTGKLVQQSKHSVLKRKVPLSGTSSDEIPIAKAKQLVVQILPSVMCIRIAEHQSITGH